MWRDNKYANEFKKLHRANFQVSVLVYLKPTPMNSQEKLNSLYDEKLIIEKLDGDTYLVKIFKQIKMLKNAIVN